MKWIRNAYLLGLIFLFIWLFIFFFGEDTLCLAALCATAVMMFINIPLQLPRWSCFLLFPLLMEMAIIVPWLIQTIHLFWIDCLLVVAVTIFILFILGPSLSFQSYVPFLFLFALNLNTKMMHPVQLSVAAFLCGVILAITYAISHRKRQSPPHLWQLLTVTFKQHLLFIIKMVVGILIAYIIGYEIHFVKTSWIILTVISLTQVDFNDTRRKLIDRIAATLIGIFIYSFFILTVADHYPHLIPILLIVVTYFYTFARTYLVKMIFITFNALNAAVATTHTSHLSMIVSRFDFIVIGSCITLLIGLISRLIKGPIDSMTQTEIESIKEADNVENIESSENDL